MAEEMDVVPSLASEKKLNIQLEISRSSTSENRFNGENVTEEMAEGEVSSMNFTNSSELFVFFVRRLTRRGLFGGCKRKVKILQGNSSLWLKKHLEVAKGLMDKCKDGCDSMDVRARCSAFNIDDISSLVNECQPFSGVKFHCLSKYGPKNANEGNLMRMLGCDNGDAMREGSEIGIQRRCITEIEAPYQEHLIGQTAYSYLTLSFQQRIFDVILAYLQLVLNCKDASAAVRVLSMESVHAFTALRKLATQENMPIFQTAVSYVLRSSLERGEQSKWAKEQLLEHRSSIAHCVNVYHQLQDIVESDKLTPSGAVLRALRCVCKSLLSRSTDVTFSRTVGECEKALGHELPFLQVNLDAIDTVLGRTPPKMCSSGGSIAGGVTMRLIQSLIDRWQCYLDDNEQLFGENTITTPTRNFRMASFNEMLITPISNEDEQPVSSENCSPPTEAQKPFGVSESRTPNELLDKRRIAAFIDDTTPTDRSTNSNIVSPIAKEIPSMERIRTPLCSRNDKENATTATSKTDRTPKRQINPKAPNRKRNCDRVLNQTKTKREKANSNAMLNQRVLTAFFTSNCKNV